MQQYDFIKKDDIRGFRPVMKDGKWGLIDKDNTGIILCILDEEPKLFNGFILCKHEGKIGLVNLKGELVLPTIYLSIRDIDDNGQVTLEYVDHLGRLQIGYTWL